MYICIGTYVLLNNIYVKLLSSIHILCNYNETILVTCVTKLIYDVVKYKDIMKNEPIRKMK
jgi:hypothetical protein